MFNVGGGELLVILLVALIVLGPDKLPDAARKIGNVMGEIRRMSAGFQEEVRSAMDTPTKAVQSVTDTISPPAEAPAAEAPAAEAPAAEAPAAESPADPTPERKLMSVADDDDIRPIDPTGDAAA
jgi:Tat protein translocase TatB subunit